MNIVYEDAFYTQFDDGTEEVRFSEAEWAVMLTDPAFGYVCRNGHRFDPQTAQLRAEGRDVPCRGCMAAEAAYEAEYRYAQLESEERLASQAPDVTGERSEQPFLI